MNAAKHTPGPWELDTTFGRQGLIQPVGRDYPVAAVTGYYTNAGQTEANARLIAAAPEMLEALRDCREALRSIDATCELRVVNAAIAKATGEAA